MGPSAAMNRFRPDIQGLRAIAVIAVLLFHVWPGVVPAGFVGVDVFFVISGFLITGLLLREIERTGSISLLDFYERRVRRLLPAAVFVLLVVALATPLLPETRWAETAVAIAASALYVENWHLSWLAIDYFGAENPASPVQHYWSLSIEEQFYVVWPLVMIGVAGFALHTARDLRKCLFIVLAGISAVSLAASIALTATTPETAYFVTHTRIWELGLGGLLAFAPPLTWSNRTNELARATGIAAILIACFAFSPGTAFPGYAAILPTAGAALIILAVPATGGWSIERLLALRPMQYLGDMSYSIYLWHWPIIVFYSVLTGTAPAWFDGSLLIAATLFVSHFSKRQIEDRFRRRADRPPLRAIAFGAAASIAAVLAAGAIYAVVEISQHSVVTSTGWRHRYPGAMAILAGANTPKVERFLPSLKGIRRDRADVYEKGCDVASGDELMPCEYGQEGGDVEIMLVGDSHAANWIPTLEIVAGQKSWRLTTHTKSGCPLLRVPVVRRGRSHDSCLIWGAKLLDAMKELPPDIVIFTHDSGRSIFGAENAENHEAMTSAIVDVWGHLLDLDIRVIAIRDIPEMPFNPPECLSGTGSCMVENLKMRPDPIVEAQKRRPEVDLIDMNDAFCIAGHCPLVVGNVYVWRDRDHFTATYSRTLAPELGRRLEALLDGG